MQPIKTTNAMNPAPAKGIESFPTPVIDDVVISEIVNSWKGDYQPLEYGVLWKDVSHAPNQGSFPEHKLVFQQPTSEDGQWVKRIWVNDRVNQDSYNYAIKYSAGSQEHPIYIRTYIVPRETYAPLLDGTPDPLFPSALLVDEEANRNEGELDSKYITVTRVYETIPGPEVPTRRYNERGDLETVIVQTVPPNTPPTADGLLVTQSQVEQVETGKGVKTTATVEDHALLQIKEKKEGLLGETITTDDIVDPSTNPDALSQTVIASTVEQYTATKARKRTTTASGPTSLSQKSNDGKLLGDITSTESVVAPDAIPDSVSQTILSSEVKQVDSGKAIKRNVVLNTTPILSGDQNEQGLLGIKTTTESVVDAGTQADPLSISVISSTVEPIDSVRSRKVTVESSGPTVLVGSKINERGDIETITESIVDYNTQPDKDAFLQSSSQVDPIDQSKSKKTTSTVFEYTELGAIENTEGLLGKKNTVESIVPVDSQPDELSQAVLASSVQKISKTKAVKKTTYSTGPNILSGQEIKGGLLGQTDTFVEIVGAGEQVTPISKRVIESTVEPIDYSKSKRTTVVSDGPLELSGGQNKSGLLGETVVTESIVDAGEYPDILSINTLESTVDPIDSAKSKKTTVVSFGPTSLESGILADTPTGQTVATKTNSIVDPSKVPINDYYTLKYDVNAIDSSKSESEVVKVNSWPIVSGVEYDEVIGVPIRYEEQVVKPSEYDQFQEWNVINNRSYKPIDEYKSLKRQYNREEIQKAFLDQYYVVQTQIQVSLPNKLLDVIAYTSSDYGEGGSGSQSRSVGGDSYSYSIDGGFKSSSAVNADIYFKLENGFSGYLNGEKHIFFMPIDDNGKVNQTILSELNNKNPGKDYKDWPVIKKITENIIVFTGGKSRSDSGGESQSVSPNGFAFASSGSYSYDVNRNVKTITLPDALHGSINVQKIEIGSQLPIDLSVAAEVIPATLEQTNPPKFPAGNYLMSSSMELYKWGLVKITAETVSITEEYT